MRTFGRYFANLYNTNASVKSGAGGSNVSISYPLETLLNFYLSLPALTLLSASLSLFKYAIYACSNY